MRKLNLVATLLGLLPSITLAAIFEVREINGETTNSSIWDQDEPPHFYWSMFMFRKRRTTNGKQASEA